MSDIVPTCMIVFQVVSDLCIFVEECRLDDDITVEYGRPVWHVGDGGVLLYHALPTVA